MNMTERLFRKNAHIIAVLLVIMYFLVVFVVAYPPTFTLLKDNLILITGIMALLAGVVAFQSTIKESAKRRINQDDYERLVTGETHPVFYTRIVKDVKILDKNGNATVTYKMTCRNTSEDIIPQLIHEIKHDGSLKECSATVNDKVANATFSKFIISKVNGEPNVPLSHILKIKYDLSGEKIAVDDTFTYGYDLRYENVFADMFEPLKEYTAHHIMHPTAFMILKISTPQGFKFARGDDKVGLEITDKNEVRVEREELRCKKLFSPQFFNADTEVMLEVMAPKIACTYALHFTIMKR